MNPRFLPLTLTAALASAAFLPAQSKIVSPALWADVDSTSANAFPFGSKSTPFRYLNVHDDMSGTARTILAIGLRRSGTTSTTLIPAHSITIDGFMSTAATTSASMSSTFDLNHGTDRTQVWTNRTINFPEAGTGPLPYPFLYQLPLDAPFNFAGGGPLCWEVQITARSGTPSALFHDSVIGSSSDPNMVVSRFGPGCTATGRSATFALTGASNNDWPAGVGSINATCSEGPAGAAAAFLFGGALLPTPVVLPGTANGASGPCSVLANLLYSVPGTLPASGGMTFRVPVPLRPWYHGAKVYGQVAAIDLSANALGVVITNGINHQVVAPYGAQPVGRVYRSGSLAATGTAGNGQGLVVQFTYL